MLALSSPGLLVILGLLAGLGEAVGKCWLNFYHGTHCEVAYVFRGFNHRFDDL